MLLSAQQLTYLVFGLGIISVGLCIGLLVLSSRMKKEKVRWENVLRNSDGQTIQETLNAHFDERALLTERIQAQDDRLRIVEAKIPTCQRFVGVTRYDAFEDVKGAQSFSMAMFDEEGKGVVLTNMVGRNISRLYLRSIENGVGDKDMSPEELEAIERAVPRRVLVKGRS